MKIQYFDEHLHTRSGELLSALPKPDNSDQVSRELSEIDWSSDIRHINTDPDNKVIAIHLNNDMSVYMTRDEMLKVFAAILSPAL